MKIQPLGRWVWVDLDPPPRASKTVFTGETDQSMTGTVLAAGPDCTSLKVDDRVLFPQGAGVTSKIDGVKILTVGEDEIFATF